MLASPFFFLFILLLLAFYCAGAPLPLLMIHFPLLLFYSYSDLFYLFFFTQTQDVFLVFFFLLNRMYW